jgi:ABC-type lipoprotein release transport system permease subunit
MSDGISNSFTRRIIQHAVGVDGHAKFEDQEGQQKQRPHRQSKLNQHGATFLARARRRVLS